MLECGRSRRTITKRYFLVMHNHNRTMLKRRCLFSPTLLHWCRVPGHLLFSLFFPFSPFFTLLPIFSFFLCKPPFNSSCLRNGKICVQQSSEIMGNGLHMYSCAFIFPHVWLFVHRKNPCIHFYSRFSQNRRSFCYLRGSQSSLFWFILILLCTNQITITML